MISAFIILIILYWYFIIYDINKCLVIKTQNPNIRFEKYKYEN